MAHRAQPVQPGASRPHGHTQPAAGSPVPLVHPFTPHIVHGVDVHQGAPPPGGLYHRLGEPATVPVEVEEGPAGAGPDTPIEAVGPNALGHTGFQPRVALMRAVKIEEEEEEEEEGEEGYGEGEGQGEGGGVVKVEHGVLRSPGGQFQGLGVDVPHAVIGSTPPRHPTLHALMVMHGAHGDPHGLEPAHAAHAHGGAHAHGHVPVGGSTTASMLSSGPGDSHSSGSVSRKRKATPVKRSDLE